MGGGRGGRVERGGEFISLIFPGGEGGGNAYGNKINKRLPSYLHGEISEIIKMPGVC